MILFLFWEMLPFTQQGKSIYTVNDSSLFCCWVSRSGCKPSAEKLVFLLGLFFVRGKVHWAQAILCLQFPCLHFDKRVPFHPWILSKVGVDGLVQDRRRNTSCSRFSLTSDFALCFRRDNLRIGIHCAFLFLLVNSWEKDNVEEVLV